MHTENKKELALEIIRRLKQAYPDAACSLDYNEAWKLLVSVRLAAQCTDARVNMIVPKLYEKFPVSVIIPVYMHSAHSASISLSNPIAVRTLNMSDDVDGSSGWEIITSGKSDGLR